MLTIANRVLVLRALGFIHQAKNNLLNLMADRIDSFNDQCVLEADPVLRSLDACLTKLEIATMQIYADGDKRGQVRDAEVLMTALNRARQFDGLCCDAAGNLDDVWLDKLANANAFITEARGFIDAVLATKE